MTVPYAAPWVVGVLWECASGVWRWQSHRARSFLIRLVVNDMSMETATIATVQRKHEHAQRESVWLSALLCGVFCIVILLGMQIQENDAKSHVGSG